MNPKFYWMLFSFTTDTAVKSFNRPFYEFRNPISIPTSIILNNSGAIVAQISVIAEEKVTD
jgi:hypothetical protein